jgi:predicted dinucleotide-binding enzyme
MRIGVLGSGSVAKTLAHGFLEHGHEVVVGTRTPAQLAAWGTENPAVRIGSFSDAADFAEVAVLAVKGSAAAEVLRTAGPAKLIGKIVIDVTNPISDTPPVNGVIHFFTDLNGSLMETLQEEFREIRFVKAFNSVGHATMVHPHLEGGPPTMFICGNDEAAKETVRGILDQFGWETEDLGRVEAARAIEPLCILWCIPGFLRNDWVHAYKVLR